MSLSFRQEMCNTVQSVLFEERVGEDYIGHTPNYVKVYLRTDKDLHNHIVSVKLTGICDDGMEGILL